MMATCWGIEEELEPGPMFESCIREGAAFLTRGKEWEMRD
jgi:hypothetical protein